MHATSPSTVSKLIKKLIDNGLSLVQNSFGNYAIQCAIDVKIIYLKKFILKFFRFLKMNN
jgi:hypothetical protein